MTRVRVVQKKERIDLLGWPTDVVSVDATAKKEDDDEDNIIHTIIIFIPGNCHSVLLSSLVSLIGLLLLIMGSMRG